MDVHRYGSFMVTAESLFFVVTVWLSIVLTTPVVLAQETCPGSLPEEFRIELIRLGTDSVMDGGHRVDRVYGDIGVNRENLGRFYENPETKIAAGTYKGTLRYESNHEFVQRSCGLMSRSGDFLLEISDVRASDGTPRTAILLHPGSLPSHSTGCILMGSRRRDSAGNLLPLEPSDPLVKVRRAFYGTDNPVACPNKRITVFVIEQAR
jgi:hypothetical protein